VRSVGNSLPANVWPPGDASEDLEQFTKEGSQQMTEPGAEVSSKECTLHYARLWTSQKLQTGAHMTESLPVLLFFDTILEVCGANEEGLAYNVLNSLMVKFFAEQGLEMPSPQEQGKAIAAWFAVQLGKHPGSMSSLVCLVHLSADNMNFGSFVLQINRNAHGFQKFGISGRQIMLVDSNCMAGFFLFILVEEVRPLSNA
jgi:hypothetical protein